MKEGSFFTGKRVVLSSISIWIISVILDINPSLLRALLPVGIWLIVITSIFFMYLSFTQSGNRNRLFIFCSIALIFSIIPKSSINAKIEKLQINRSQVIGMRIFNKIHEFYKINRRYPKTLNELKPNFIQKIPSTSMGLFGTDYNYDLDKESGFILRFSLSEGYLCFISAKDKKWTIEH